VAGVARLRARGWAGSLLAHAHAFLAHARARLALRCACPAV